MYSKAVSSQRISFVIYFILYCEEMGLPMKKIEAIVRPERIEEIKEALDTHGIKGITVSQVVGCGHQKGIRNFYRGTVTDLNLLPKVKLEIIADDKDADTLVSLIIASARTGEIGDGKIFIYNIEDIVRIRTGESGSNAI